MNRKHKKVRPSELSQTTKPNFYNFLCNKKSLWRIVFFGTVLIMLVLIFILQIRISALEKEKIELAEQAADQRLTVAEMEYSLDLPREDYIEKYAREVLGYHKYSDIVIKEEADE